MSLREPAPFLTPRPAAGSVFRGNASQAGATSKSLEVRSVLYWAEMEHFIAVGWSRALMCYADKPSFGQAQLPDWNESRHRADVMLGKNDRIYWWDKKVAGEEEAAEIIIDIIPMEDEEMRELRELRN